MSPPGADRGRPLGRSGPSVNNLVPDRKTTARIGEATDSAMLDALALTGDPVWLCGYESGYLAGREHGRGQFAVGRRQAVEEQEALWAEVARAVRLRAGQPSYRELLRRRGLPDPGPVAPVPSYAECLASWARPVERREVAV